MVVYGFDRMPAEKVPELDELLRGWGFKIKYQGGRKILWVGCPPDIPEQDYYINVYYNPHRTELPLTFQLNNLRPDLPWLDYKAPRILRFFQRIMELAEPTQIVDDICEPIDMAEFQ